MIEDIHFLYNEIEDKINSDVEKILFQIKHPQSGKQMGILQEITKQLVLARARQMHAEEEQQTREMSALRDRERDILEESGTIPSATFKPSMTVAGVTEKAEAPGSSPEHEGMIKVLTLHLITDNASGQVLSMAEVSDTFYHVYEPELMEPEIKLLKQAEQDIGQDYSLLENNRSLLKQLFKSAKRANVAFSEDDLLKMKYYLVRDLASYHAAEPLTHDPAVQKVICNGPGIPIEVIREGKPIKTNVVFSGKDELNTFLNTIAQKTFQKVSPEEPVLDAVFRGFRIQGLLGTDVIPTKFIMTRV